MTSASETAQNGDVGRATAASVLVVGGTGTVGRSVVAELARRGHPVRIFSRRAGAEGAKGAAAAAPEGVTMARGDALTGAGLDRALDGIDTVVHAVANLRRPQTTEVGAMRTMLGSIGDRHLINVSIVGVDKNHYAYYKAKLKAERLLESSSAKWTNQRATQFHDLIERFLGLPMFFRTPNLRFQPIDTRDVAVRLADLVAAGPSGHAPDLGGPAVLGIVDLAQVRRDITGRRARLVRMPRLGFIGDFDRGDHLTPGGSVDGITWANWLRSGIAGSDGSNGSGGVGGSAP